MGRLYGAIEPKDLVHDWAFFYALNEQLYEDFGKGPFTDLDSQLVDDVYWARREIRAIELWAIAEKYGDDPRKLREMNLPAGETEQVGVMRKLQEKVREEEQDERKRKAEKQV